MCSNIEPTVCILNNNIKKAVDVSQRAQRNYDLSKTIPENDLHTLIYAAKNSPAKQNETHYALEVYTDPELIHRVYNETKKFTLGSLEQEGLFKETNGKFWQDQERAVRNSQILANVLFVYTRDTGPARGGTHLMAKKCNKGESFLLYTEQQNFSIGISVGQLILSATLLGYKTGICSAFSSSITKATLGLDKKPVLLVGVGYDQLGTDRRLHAETLNKDILITSRNGELNEKWRFPSFEKHTSVKINGKEIKNTGKLDGD